MSQSSKKQEIPFASIGMIMAPRKFSEFSAHDLRRPSIVYDSPALATVSPKMKRSKFAFRSREDSECSTHSLVMESHEESTRRKVVKTAISTVLGTAFQCSPVFIMVVLVLLVWLLTAGIIKLHKQQLLGIMSTTVEEIVRGHFTEQQKYFELIEYLVANGEVNANTTIEEYELLTLPFYRTQSLVQAVYFATSERVVWKHHRANPPYISTQVRIWVNESYQYRYDRVRLLNTSLTEFEIEKYVVKAYDPLEQEWFQTAIEIFPETSITGPHLSSGNDNTYGDHHNYHVMTLSRKHEWFGNTTFSVVKMKLSIKSFHELLTTIVGDYLSADAEVFLCHANGAVITHTQCHDVYFPNMMIWELKESHITESEFFEREKDSSVFLDVWEGRFVLVVFVGSKAIFGDLTTLASFVSVLFGTTVLVVVAVAAFSIFKLCRVEANVKKQTKEKMLAKILPKEYVSHLLRGKRVMKTYKAVCILFCDLVSFTKITQSLSPMILSSFLNEIFDGFDATISKHQCTKVKNIGFHLFTTIRINFAGDAYFVLSGCPKKRSIKAMRLLKCAFEMLGVSLSQRTLDVKIGIHSGDIISGIVGRSSFSFDSFGKNVNIAARLESSSERDKIHVSQPFKDHFKKEEKKLGRKNVYVFLKREKKVKLKGVDYDYPTYFVEKLPSGDLQKFGTDYMDDIVI